MKALTRTEVEVAYRNTAHAAADEEQRTLGPSEGRANEAPAIRPLPRWLNQRSATALLAQTHGPAEGSEPA